RTRRVSCGRRSASAKLWLTVPDLDARVALCIAAPQQEGDRESLFGLGDERVDLLRALGIGRHALADQCDDYVADLYVAADIARNVLDQHTVLDVELLLLLLGEIGEHQPHPVGLRLVLGRSALARDFRRFLVLELGDRDVEILHRALAPDLQRNLRARL